MGEESQRICMIIFLFIPDSLFSTNGYFLLRALKMTDSFACWSK